MVQWLHFLDYGQFYLILITVATSPDLPNVGLVASVPAHTFTQPTVDLLLLLGQLQSTAT